MSEYSYRVNSRRPSWLQPGMDEIGSELEEELAQKFEHSESET
jgi:hypothetical protein